MQCPICKTEFPPTATDTMPFCSARCRSIDLGRWLEESYSLPLVSDPEEDELSEDHWADDRSPATEDDAR